MAQSTAEKIPSQTLRARVLQELRVRRDASDADKQPGKPARRSANEITSAIGLTPITGRSGPRIAY